MPTHLSIRYTERLAQAGIDSSVGSKGDSYDNALAETINGLYKAEVIYHPRQGTWKSVADVELATLNWVSWFNKHRLLERSGYIASKVKLFRSKSSRRQRHAFSEEKARS